MPRGSIDEQQELIRIRELLTDVLLAVRANTEDLLQHFHNKETWFGKSADQSGNDWAEIETLTPYQVRSGASGWGTGADRMAKIVGLGDWGVVGTPFMDLHKILVVGQNSSTVYRMRVIWGTGTAAEGLVAGNCTNFVYMKPSSDALASYVDIRTPEIAANNKIWIQSWNATAGATVDFFVGVNLHTL